MTKEFKINNFDLLRLFAALEVVLLHSYPHLNLPYPAFFNVILNFPGVTMFFVMSGFLISASLERNNDLRVYFKNRAFRIFPALWACIILTVIVIAACTKRACTRPGSAPWMIIWGTSPWAITRVILWISAGKTVLEKGGTIGIFR